MSEQIALLKQLTNNTVTSRAAFVQFMLDQLHDIDKECGYPITISAEEYKRMYEREGIAARVVSIYPTETWAVEPEIYDSEDQDLSTPFEEAWLYVNKKHSMLEKFSRLDEICGIGHYGIFLMGIDDGLPLDQPVAGVEEKLKAMFEKELIRKKQNADPKQKLLEGPAKKPLSDVTAEDDEEIPGDPKKKLKFNAASKLQKVKGNAAAEQDDIESSPAETDTGLTKEDGKPKRRLLFVTPFDETQAQISAIVTDPKNWRYGKPEYYNLTFFSPNDYTGVYAVPSENQTKVHWTRVVHVADNCKSNEIFGTPRMKKVYNRLLDIRKMLGGAAEMFWKGGFPGYAFEVPPEINDQVELDREGLAKEVDLFMNTLKKYMALQGVSAKVLQGTIADPQNHLDVHILAICIALEVPKRVFMGTEEAKIASIEDATAWLNRVKSRQQKQVTPRLIRPTIDLLIAYGILPEPEEYFVDWNDLHTSSDADKASVAAQLTTAIVQYVSGGGDSLLAPLEFLTLILQMDREVAIAALQAAEERAGDTAGEQQAMEDQQMMMQQDQMDHEHAMQQTVADGLAEGAKQGGVNIPQGMIGGGGPPKSIQTGGGKQGMPPQFGKPKPKASGLPIPRRPVGNLSVEQADSFSDTTEGILASRGLCPECGTSAICTLRDEENHAVCVAGHQWVGNTLIGNSDTEERAGANGTFHMHKNPTASQAEALLDKYGAVAGGFDGTNYYLFDGGIGVHDDLGKELTQTAGWDLDDEEPRESVVRSLRSAIVSWAQQKESECSEKNGHYVANVATQKKVIPTMNYLQIDWTRTLKELQEVINQAREENTPVNVRFDLQEVVLNCGSEVGAVVDHAKRVARNNFYRLLVGEMFDNVEIWKGQEQVYQGSGSQEAVVNAEATKHLF